MKDKFSSDNPVGIESEDKFQRYPFAKRIAESITNNTSSDCITYGIYGEWGEGKSSVINFIEKELTSKKILTFKYNPWRFSDESSMIIQFFDSLAKIYDESLMDSGEKIKETLNKYSEVIAAIPKIGGILSALIKKNQKPENLDALRNKIEEILVRKKIKLVIFIDDIDRLDKDEIFTILRLVKLTGNFPNLIYILAFDEKMVAQALSARFGRGDNNSGSDFLEKIIQVPLYLPLAQPEALEQYCLEQITFAFSINKLNVVEDDLRRFRLAFSGNILPVLTTPRLANRYGNSLAFTLPLVYGEVNLSDLLLIEAVKVFYPDYYDFIKYNQKYFLYTYKNSTNSNSNNSKIKKFKEEFEIIGRSYTDTQTIGLTNILTELFPVLKEALTEDFQYVISDIDYIAEYYQEKRIASPNYFKRYFSYTVIRGQISDLHFNEILNSLDKLDISEIITEFDSLIKIGGENEFMAKIRQLPHTTQWSKIKKVIIGMAHIGHLFSKRSFGGSPFYSDTITQSAIVIIKLLKDNINEADVFKFSKKLMTDTPSFDFTMEINTWMRSGKSLSEKMFKLEEYNEMAGLLIERARIESDGIPIFVKFPQHTFYLFGAWVELDSKTFNEYITTILQSDTSLVIDLIKTFTPKIYTTAQKEPFTSDFQEEHFVNFTRIFNKDFVHEIIRKEFDDVVLSKEEVVWRNMQLEQTDLNLIRQFLYWYNDEENIPKEITSP